MNDHECCKMAGGYVCCLSIYQAERTRAEEQLREKDDQIHQKDGQLQQKTRELEHEHVRVNVVT